MAANLGAYSTLAAPTPRIQVNVARLTLRTPLRARLHPPTHPRIVPLRSGRVGSSAARVAASAGLRASSSAAGASVPSLTDGQRFNSPDNNFEENRLAPGHGDQKRAYTYFVLGGARFL